MRKAETAIDRERLARDFIRLCETDSPSGKEGRIAGLLKEIFSGLGADSIVEDDSATVTGSDTGNLFIRFEGTIDIEPVFFNCHMDTVEPARGVKVRRQDDLFYSNGDTVLGSDDKSGIAAVIEALRCLREQRVDHGPLELVFTTCEETGLLGAKAMDPSMIRARMGYALDSTGFGKVITGAPAANRLDITLRGLAAHAGLHPEKGISAIMLAARAIANAPHGRIDELSTVNFGTIQGGKAINIVADEVRIQGEVRSHSNETLARITSQLEDTFAGVIEEWPLSSGQTEGRPELIFTVTPDFPLMHLDRNDPVISRIEQAAASIGLDMEYQIAGGGSDANIFNGYGLQTAIIATGMNNVHSTEEWVSLQDMTDLSRLLVALITA